MRISQLRSILSSASNLPILSKISTFERSRAVGGKHLPNSLLVTFLVISILTALVGERFYNQPQLSVNSVAPETIKAPKSQNFIDWEATLEKRKESQSSIVPVIERNTYLTRSILSNLEQKLNLFTKFRQQAGGFPFFSTELLSLKSQEYLRKCNDEQWNYFKVNTFNQEFHKKLKSSDLDKLEQIINGEQNITSFAEVIDPETPSVKKSKRAIDQINKDTGEVIKTYDSIEAAGRGLGLTTGTAVGIALREKRVCQGYLWRYSGISKEEQFNEQPIIKVCCSTGEKTFFKTIADAARDVKISAPALRQRVLKNVHINGHHWTFNKSANHYI
jgi:hypothetical protein